MKTLYNLTQNDAIALLSHFNNDTDKIALLFYNRGIAKSLPSAIKKVIRLKNFINN